MAKRLGGAPPIPVAALGGARRASCCCVFDNARNAFGAAQGGAEVLGKSLVGECAKPFEQRSVALEIGAQHFGDSQDIVAVRHRRQHVFQDKARGRLNIFLVAGRAKPPALAGEGQQILMLAMVAANPGKASLQIAAFLVAEAGQNENRCVEVKLPRHEL